MLLVLRNHKYFKTFVNESNFQKIRKMYIFRGEVNFIKFIDFYNSF